MFKIEFKDMGKSIDEYIIIFDRLKNICKYVFNFTIQPDEKFCNPRKGLQRPRRNLYERISYLGNHIIFECELFPAYKELDLVYALNTNSCTQHPRELYVYPIQTVTSNKWIAKDVIWAKMGRFKSLKIFDEHSFHAYEDFSENVNKMITI